MKKPLDYQAKKLELDAIMSWFESGDVSIDEALIKCKQAEALIKELETYLSDVKAKVNQLTKHSVTKK